MKNNMYQNKFYRPNNERFIFPFLVGALTGGAAIGLTRPRPIYNVAPYQQMPTGPYGYSSYAYYYPNQPYSSYNSYYHYY